LAVLGLLQCSALPRFGRNRVKAKQTVIASLMAFARAELAGKNTRYRALIGVALGVQGIIAIPQAT
jgi:hypothetical protein